MPHRCVSGGLSAVRHTEEGRPGAVLYSGAAVGNSGVWTTGLEKWQVGSHRELRRAVLGVKKWDDVSPWEREWEGGAPRSSLNAVPVVALALTDLPVEEDNLTTILWCSM